MEDEEKKENEMEETKEIVKEPIKSEPEKNNSNIIIIILSAVIVILVIILLLVLLGGNKKEDKDKKEEPEKEEKEDISDKDIAIDKMNSHNAKFYYNKYIVDYENKRIINLDGKKLSDIDTSWTIRQGENKSLIIYKTDKNNTIVKRIINDEVDEKQYSGLISFIVDAKTDKILGIVNKEKDHDVLDLYTDKDVNSVDLENLRIYTFSTAEGQDKYIYNNRYIVTSGNSKVSNHGLYDIKDKKELIEKEYTGIEYLHDDIFVAIQDDYSGVIDKNNKILLDFDYDSIQYSNGLYFVANNSTLEILDSDFKNLNSPIEIPNLKHFTYNPCCGERNPYILLSYKDYVVVGILQSQSKDFYKLIVVDKEGNQTDLGMGEVAVVNNYLVVSSATEKKIVMYNDKLEEKNVLTTKEEATHLAEPHLFLDKVLSLEGLKFYNLPNGSEKESVSPIRRTSQEYEVKIEFKNGKGTLTVSKDEEVLATLDNVSVNNFLASENNGIIITKTHFIYSDGSSLIILKKQEN